MTTKLINGNSVLLSPNLHTVSYELNALGDIAQLSQAAFTSINLDIRGTFTATLVVETSVDGINWLVNSITAVSTGAISQSITTTGRYISYINAGVFVRVRVSAYTSGTVVLNISASNIGDGQVVVSNGSTNPITVAPTTRNCTGRQTISVTTGAVSTLTPPGGSVACSIQADGTSVSVTLDGTTPTATVGSRIDDGIFFYVDTALANVKLIARVATTNVQVAYFDKA